MLKGDNNAYFSENTADKKLWGKPQITICKVLNTVFNSMLKTPKGIFLRKISKI